METVMLEGNCEEKRLSIDQQQSEGMRCHGNNASNQSRMGLFLASTVGYAEFKRMDQIYSEKKRRAFIL